MTENGTFTYQEIMSQPAVWEQTLGSFHAQSGEALAAWRASHAQRVLVTGCGSTYYLALIAASLFQSLTGQNCQARPASELVLTPDLVFAPNDNVLLVAISRSGTTTETIDAVDTFRRRQHGTVLVVTCDGGSPLAQRADAVLTAETAQERSVAQTRSFSSMTVLVEALAGALAGLPVESTLAPLPALCQRLLEDHHDLARRLGSSPEIERFFFLGTGWLYGLADEAMLKMKEMSLSYSEAFHFLEFRHGPMSMVNDRTLMVGLLSEHAQRHEAAVLQQMTASGAQVLALSEAGSGLAPAPRLHEVALRTGLPQWARTIAYLPVLHLLAYYRALANGQNPDRPANLTAVVSLTSLLSS